MSFISRAPRHVMSAAALAGLLLFAAGCARMPVTPPPPEEPAAERAEARAAQGEYAAAATLYEQAARDAEGNERNRLWLAAGEAAARAGETQRATTLLERVDATALDEAQRARLRLARTEARIADMPPVEALDALPPPASGTPPAVAARTWALRSELLLAQGEIAKAVHALVQRDIWLPDPERGRANDQRIWETLREHADAIGDPASIEDIGQTTRGWLALARIGDRVWTDRAALEDALIDWERRYPGHPAGRSVLPERFDYRPIAPGTAVADGRGLGLALPLSGRFGAPAAAVRDGFLAAYYASERPRPRLHIYDTEAVADMAALLEQARADGVGVLVGPLAKRRVAELRSIENMDMPVLALNYAEDSNGFPGYYEFGLAPEDEARAAAERAVRMGLPRGLALIPDNDWGDRILDALRDELRYNGGELVDYARYDKDRQDFAGPIKTLLHYRGVPEDEATEDAPPETDENGDPIERGRRQDADFVFVAAQPAQARLIRTQLRFYRATQLPVLATSHVYTGRVDPARDTDLDGLMFPDMPWTLSGEGDIAERRGRIERLWPEAANRFPRLFALGQDAWRLQGLIRQGAMETGDLFAGSTGRLHMQSNGEVHRALDWAKFVRGRPEPLPPAIMHDAGLLPAGR